MNHYQTVLSMNRSGTNDADTVALAMDLFNKIEKRPFAMIHCWEILKNQAKWLDIVDGKSRQDYGPDEDDCEETEGDEGERISQSVDQRKGSDKGVGMKRPIGRDAAKAKAKKTNSADAGPNSIEVYSRMTEIAMLKLEAYQKSGEENKVVMDKFAAIAEAKLVMKRELHQDSMKVAEGKNEIEKIKAETLRSQAEIASRNSDIEVMAMDLSKCTPEQRIVAERMHKLVVAKWSAM